MQLQKFAGFPPVFWKSSPVRSHRPTSVAAVEFSYPNLPSPPLHHFQPARGIKSRLPGGFNPFRFREKHLALWGQASYDGKVQELWNHQPSGAQLGWSSICNLSNLSFRPASLGHASSITKATRGRKSREKQNGVSGNPCPNIPRLGSEMCLQSKNMVLICKTHGCF